MFEDLIRKFITDEGLIKNLDLVLKVILGIVIAVVIYIFIFGKSREPRPLPGTMNAHPKTKSPNLYHHGHLAELDTPIRNPGKGEMVTGVSGPLGHIIESETGNAFL